MNDGMAIGASGAGQTSLAIEASGAGQTSLAIEASGLAKSYRDVRVLDGVDLSIPRGSVFALLGPNGAGKPVTGL